ncbi:MAG: hypothetical protein CMN30_34135, partial [Sandaracinus sp.]|nr:hypothetical protein [Sandaracinus sp.]
MIEKHTGSAFDALRALRRTPLPSLRRLMGGTGLALSLLAGCAGATTGEGTTPAEEAARDEAEREEARARRLAEAERQARIRELETQLAMARAETDDLRSRGSVQTETVRIGGEDASDGLFDDAEGDWEVPAEHLPETEPEAQPEARRPVLRLYGERPVEPEPVLADPSFAPVANVPVRAPELRLATAPVAPMPEPSTPPWVAGASSGAAGTVATPARPTVDGGREAYERALGHFRERRVGEAAQELERMLTSYPGHALAGRARYWLAESLYIQR